MYSLLTQKAFDFIAPHENFIKQTYIAYWDKSRYSIGFGTISYAGEVISLDEASKRAKDYIQKDVNELENQSWFSVLSDSQKIAILDFAYQAGKYGLKFGNLKNAVISGAIDENDFVTGWEDQSRVNNRWNMFNSAPKIDIYTASIALPFIILIALALLKKLIT